ncbi:unnamed protein product [Anisakis simplex]|uniref:Uncharacterized protein n=1 Tax=Anisakis simplex TaxID=6269 RepID=A0A0M3JEG1_ANISI|nr:unnamed protein product [Anisakis simplex]
MSKYEDNKIEDILMRFEKPDGKNRWDSPLFTIGIGNIDLHQQQQPEQLCASEAVQPESDGSKANNSPRHVRIPFDEIFASLVKVWFIHELLNRFLGKNISPAR